MLPLIYLGGAGCELLPLAYLCRTGCDTSEFPADEGPENVQVLEDPRSLGITGCKALGRIEAEDGKVARDSSRYVGSTERAITRFKSEAAKLGGDTAAIEQELESLQSGEDNGYRVTLIGTAYKCR